MGTLKDIANLTNLSMNTVSRVLRNSGYVSPETARKVNEAVKQIFIAKVPEKGVGLSVMDRLKKATYQYKK
jgi:transcriptional regulator with XRE-family HTH domain